MTKTASRKLHIASAKCMEVAEKLYQRGYISYPRTETDSFPATLDLQGLLREQIASDTWGDYASRLEASGSFQWPRSGRNNDQAHPPIHPVKLAQRSELEGDVEWKLYEFVVRHFLACCSHDAEGFQTRVRINVADEGFHTKGLIVTQRNYLDVYYPYESWSGAQLPLFLLWESFMPQSITMHEGKTEPPPLLTEADLIDLMDKNGIGTDATMHDHIKTIQDRNYAKKNDRGFFEGTSLGCALVSGFRSICACRGEVDISKPLLRAQMENQMGQVARGAQRKEQVLTDTVACMRRVFQCMSQNMTTLDATIGHYMSSPASG